MVTSRSILPDDYAVVLDQLKKEVRGAQLRAHRHVNTELLRLYWSIGKAILDRQQVRGWGAKVVEQLAVDLRAEFPDVTGLSRSNLHYMRKFAASWSLDEFVPQPVGQLPWGHIRALLDQVSEPATRDW